MSLLLLFQGSGVVEEAPFKRHLGSEPLPIPPYRLTLDYSQSLNLGLIQQAAATIIPRQWDWPNPRIPVYPVHQLVPNLLTTTLVFVQAPFRPAEWKNPAPLNRPHGPHGPPNLLLSTLAAPFKQGDWSIPQIAKRGPAPQDSPNPGLTTRAPVPFLSKDWPNPRIPARATAQQAYPSLLTTTLAAAPAAPFKPAQWPNPIVGRATFGDVTVNLHLTTLATAPAAPFHQTEWFNPRNPIRITRGHEGANLLLTTLATPAPVVADTPTGGSWLPTKIKYIRDGREIDDLNAPPPLTEPPEPDFDNVRDIAAYLVERDIQSIIDSALAAAASREADMRAMERGLAVLEQQARDDEDALLAIMLAI